jgi:glycosyltransferase involved in cell wall biosynthesis
MRVAITADPELPIPPRQQGGIERIVHMVVAGLAARGHDVTLFAHGDSTPPCRLVPYPGRRSRPRLDLIRNTTVVSGAVLRGRFDVVHSFGRLAYLWPILALPVPKVMSYQRVISPRSVAWGRRLSHGTLHFTVCGAHMRRRFAGDDWHVIYNGVPLAAFAFRDRVPDDAPLVFLGRLEELKGPHLAIEVARGSGRRLVIAGDVPPEHQAYFDARIAPALDGDRVRYIGPVDDVQKNALLGGAAAFLMPIQLEEAFGIVMAEAMACGTPVIALRRGAVPEVVEDGVTGVVCDTVDEMVAAVGRIGSLDRRAARRRVEERFSDTAVVGAYERLYASLIDPRGPVHAAEPANLSNGSEP